MQAEFWEELWEKGEIGFHKPEVHRFLERFFPRLEIPAGSRVLVPLCGKSLDMLWLAEQGWQVLGIEFAAQAVAAFFAENGLVVERRPAGPFESWRAGRIEILAGDLFDLDPAFVGPLAAIYDRAALVALPPEMRPAYAAKLAELLPTGGELLLTSYAYRQAEMAGPPFAVPRSEIKQLFGSAFELTLLDEEDALERHAGLRAAGLTTLYEFCCRLKRR